MKDALAWLARGGVVAAPTETFFGLIADATRAEAVTSVCALKPRPAKGIPLILPSRDAWRSLVVEVPPLANRLADAFWPGALTIVLPARGSVDARLTLDGCIAARWPGASLAGDLARALDRPLTATSANAPGSPPAVEARAVRDQFADAIEIGELLVVDGRCPGGLPSTVVLVTGESFSVVRAGRITERALLEALER